MQKRHLLLCCIDRLDDLDELPALQRLEDLVKLCLCQVTLAPDVPDPGSDIAGLLDDGEDDLLLLVSGDAGRLAWSLQPAQHQ